MTSSSSQQNHQPITGQDPDKVGSLTLLSDGFNFHFKVGDTPFMVGRQQNREKKKY